MCMAMYRLFAVLLPYTLSHSHPYTGLIAHKLFFPHCHKFLCVHCNFLEGGRSAWRAWRGQSEEGRMLRVPCPGPSILAPGSQQQESMRWARLSPLLSPETLLEMVQATCPGDSSCQSATLAALLCFSVFLLGPCTEGG